MSEIQALQDGTGTIFERVYWVEVKGSVMTAAEVMTYVRRHFDQFCPDLLAKFEKTEGKRELRVGDEFHIKIVGPWNGDVTVAQVSERAFQYQTLVGHPEAGTIDFEATDLPASSDPQSPDTSSPALGNLRFEIRSVAAARDGVVSFFHEKLGVGMKIQEQMWLSFCARVADFTHGEVTEPPQSRTVERGNVEEGDAPAIEAAQQDQA